jgi:hypothetical protein
MPAGLTKEGQAYDFGYATGPSCMNRSSTFCVIRATSLRPFLHGNA